MSNATNRALSLPTGRESEINSLTLDSLNRLLPVDGMEAEKMIPHWLKDGSPEWEAAVTDRVRQLRLLVWEGASLDEANERMAPEGSTAGDDEIGSAAMTALRNDHYCFPSRKCWGPDIPVIRTALRHLVAWWPGHLRDCMSAADSNRAFSDRAWANVAPDESQKDQYGNWPKSVVDAVEKEERELNKRFDIRNWRGEAYGELLRTKTQAVGSFDISLKAGYDAMEAVYRNLRIARAAWETWARADAKPIVMPEDEDDGSQRRKSVLRSARKAKSSLFDDSSQRVFLGIVEDYLLEVSTGKGLLDPTRYDNCGNHKPTINLRGVEVGRLSRFSDDGPQSTVDLALRVKHSRGAELLTAASQAAVVAAVRRMVKDFLRDDQSGYVVLHGTLGYGILANEHGTVRGATTGQLRLVVYGSGPDARYILCCPLWPRPVPMTAAEFLRAKSAGAAIFRHTGIQVCDWPHVWGELGLQEALLDSAETVDTSARRQDWIEYARTLALDAPPADRPAGNGEICRIPSGEVLTDANWLTDRAESDGIIHEWERDGFRAFWKEDGPGRRESVRRPEKGKSRRYLVIDVESLPAPKSPRLAGPAPASLSGRLRDDESEGMD